MSNISKKSSVGQKKTGLLKTWGTSEWPEEGGPFSGARGRRGGQVVYVGEHDGCRHTKLSLKTKSINIIKTITAFLMDINGKKEYKTLATYQLYMYVSLLFFSYHIPIFSYI